MKRYLRVLPAAIFVAALMLGVKLGDIWNGITGEPPTGATKEVARSLAQLAPGAGNEAARSLAQLAPGAGNEAAPGDAATEAQAPESPPPSDTTGITAALATDPINFSQSEIELLLALAARREQLAERERDVEQREAMLSALEKWIEQQIASLKDAKKRISALLEKQKTSQDKAMQRLVKVYENMKPKAAARVFDKMGKRVLLHLAARMKEAKLALILAQMDPAKANVVSAELVRRHELPRPPGPMLDFAELLVEAQDVDR